jgi:hypothetical protein
MLCAAAVAAVFALACMPRPAAAADPVIGVGEQAPGVFSSAWWQRLDVRDVRHVVAWDALAFGWQRAELDVWMAAARAAGARVLLGFGHSRSETRRRILPSPSRFRRELRRFRARYPWVRDYLTWNEANHCSQPTCRRPDVAARYYNVLRRECRGCRIVAADVLDTRRMPAWLRAFRRHAHGTRFIWGLHNYIDANRFRTRGTRALLRAVRGDVWFTETGGLVERRNGSPIDFPENVWHAARATRWVFRLARLSPRVKRVYFYHWQPARAPASWDSALVDERGVPRPAYDVVRNFVRAAAQRAARARG